MVNFNFYNPTKIIFGSGKLDELAGQELPGKKALLLISCGKSTRVNGSLARVQAALDKAGVSYVLFDKIMENPVKEVVMEGAACARENGCDFILALGGGAVLDSSKAIAAMATNDGDLWDYVVGGTGKGKPLANKGLPIVTVPTSSGTGSEINCWGVISNLQTKEKIGFGAECLTPVLSVVDPELMRTVPPRYTAYQGFDALFHNTEVMMSKGVNVLSEAIALSAIENIAAYLPRAVADGNDLEAREHVAYGATVAGMTMQLTSTTAQHSMEPRDERLPPQSAARRRAYHDLRGIRAVFHRKARLRRTVRQDGARHGDARSGQAGRFPDGARCFAEGVRRGRVENVRLRHCQGGVYDAGGQRARDDGRTLSRQSL